MGGGAARTATASSGGGDRSASGSGSEGSLVRRLADLAEEAPQDIAPGHDPHKARALDHGDAVDLVLDHEADRAFHGFVRGDGMDLLGHDVPDEAVLHLLERGERLALLDDLDEGDAERDL